MTAPDKGKSAVVVIVDGVEELEAVAPVDCLRRAGVDVTVASASTALDVEGRNGIRLIADRILADCRDNLFDLVVIPGGPGHTTLAQDPRVLELLRTHAAAGRLIGSICAGPVVLEEAGVLEGHAYTSHPVTADALPGRDQKQPVVVDRNIITSQGAGTAVDFGLALVEAILDRNTSQLVAASICH
jgi:4-methyl-5(b-hydroxyethyl)-thiazole monophosphate biosynthesis